MLGLEIAGTIVALGSDTTEFDVGDEVCALVSEGGYAEYCVAPVTQVLPKPACLDLVASGGIMENLCTAWVSLFDCLCLTKGDWVLVHGGAGGFGLTALQLARAVGASVIATAGSEEKCQACLRHGADIAINYRSQDFAQVVKDRVGSVQAIVDIVGGRYFQTHMRLLSLNGRLCVLGLKGGATAEIDLADIMRRRLTITGSTVRTRSDDERTRIVHKVHQLAWPLIESGLIKFPIDSEFELSRANEAHRYFESGAHIGKVLLVPERPS